MRGASTPVGCSGEGTVDAGSQAAAPEVATWMVSTSTLVLDLLTVLYLVTR